MLITQRRTFLTLANSVQVAMARGGRAGRVCDFAHGAREGVRSGEVLELREVGKRVTRAAVLDGLEQHRFAHFTGSVKLVPGPPFDAPFGLHGDDRVTLLDVARCHLPSAEFAFLSASHTAELTDASHPDEALHLVAAMLHCGFHSIVGTMWAGRGKGRGQGQEEVMVPYHERAAKAHGPDALCKRGVPNRRRDARALLEDGEDGNPL